MGWTGNRANQSSLPVFLLHFFPTLSSLKFRDAIAQLQGGLSTWQRGRVADSHASQDYRAVQIRDTRKVKSRLEIQRPLPGQFFLLSVVIMQSIGLRFRMFSDFHFTSAKQSCCGVILFKCTLDDNFLLQFKTRLRFVVFSLDKILNDGSKLP